MGTILFEFKNNPVVICKGKPKKWKKFLPKICCEWMNEFIEFEFDFNLNSVEVIYILIDEVISENVAHYWNTTLPIFM